MKYRDRTTGQIYTLFDIQQKFSTVSFPSVWDETTYDFANVDPVRAVPQPIPTSLSNIVEYVGVKLVNGEWTDVWNEVPRYSDSDKQMQWEAECVETQWNNVRAHRDMLLQKTDYIMLPDIAVSAEAREAFIAYRQSLRDITTQSDPYNIVWPILPPR